MNKHLRILIILKVVIGVGLTASYFLPPQHSIPLSIATNMLWLWKG